VDEVSLHGKVALVTGAASGLGQATAHAFARAGSDVACVDVDAEAVERAGGEVRRYDVRNLALTCDVADADAVSQMVERVAAAFGRLDVVVNCAAIDHTVSVADLSVAQWD
jgi:NAD(P)-dependent dehydrogenase (short-subunit alcohol dehydrogenase family)